MYSDNQHSTTFNVTTKHTFSHLKCNKPGSFSKVLLAYSDRKENSRARQALTQVGGNRILQSVSCKAQDREFYHYDLRDEKNAIASAVFNVWLVEIKYIHFQVYIS